MFFVLEESSGSMDAGVILDGNESSHVMLLSSQINCIGFCTVYMRWEEMDEITNVAVTNCAFDSHNPTTNHDVKDRCRRTSSFNSFVCQSFLYVEMMF